MSGLPPPNVLTYEGQVAVPFINRTTDPTTSNYQFNVPTIWVNTSAERGFILLGKPMNVADWFPFAGSTTVTETLTGNSGGAIPPTANNINVVGAGSITTVGTPGTSTLTVELTGLTDHAIQVGAGTTTLTQVGPSATAGQVLQSGGASADPSFSTATYPSTTTVNQILYSSATNVVSGLATVNDASLSTNASGVPTWLAMTDGQVVIGSSAGAPAAATLTAGSGITITNGHNSISIAATAVSNAFDTINVQVFTSSGTYTPTAGMKYCIIEVVGGGGGGGATTATGAAQVSAGSGGGGGGYARKTVSAATIGVSQAVTIGAAGAAGAVSGGNGGSGGTTSVGAIVSATGGGGGVGSPVASSVIAQEAGTPGAGSSGDFNTNGTPGFCSFGLGALSVGFGGAGGSSFFGGGSRGRSATASVVPGGDAASYGGGGSGAITLASSAAAAGGAGFAGIVVITEFLSV